MVISILFMLIISCARNESPGPNVVARVKDNILTLSEVNAWEASLQHTAQPEARLAYIRHWVEDEIIFQSAVELGLSEDPWVVQRLDEITRALLISRYLQLDEKKISKPAPSAVRAYYQEHAGEFVWAHIHLEVEYWRCKEKSKLTSIRTELLRGNNNAINLYSPGLVSNGKINLDGPESSDPEVWKIVSRMKPLEVSKVSKINNEHWIFRLIRKQSAGDQREIEEVRDVIVSRLMEEARSQRYEAIIRSLFDEYRRKGWLDWSTPSPTISVSDSIEVE